MQGEWTVISIHPETDVSEFMLLAISIQLSAKGIKNKYFSDPARSGKKE
jgi:hypothetical protein